MEEETGPRTSTSSYRKHMGFTIYHSVPLLPHGAPVNLTSLFLTPKKQLHFLICLQLIVTSLPSCCTKSLLCPSLITVFLLPRSSACLMGAHWLQTPLPVEAPPRLLEKRNVHPLPLLIVPPFLPEKRFFQTANVSVFRQNCYCRIVFEWLPRLFLKGSPSPVGCVWFCILLLEGKAPRGCRALALSLSPWTVGVEERGPRGAPETAHNSSADNQGHECNRGLPPRGPRWDTRHLSPICPSTAIPAHNTHIFFFLRKRYTC